MTTVDPRGTQYSPLPPDRPPQELEEELLARWAEEGLFARTEAERAGAPEFVFFEGPPTANGRPGIHHVFARTIKDLFCRYRVMKGYRVTRKAGWDTHGLPVEIEVEKQLGISGKQDIEALGVEMFNKCCRESVWKYRGDWEKLSERIGYFLDYEHPYVTYSNEYVESVWWALATLYEKDRLYRGHKILPYCPRCGTALSSHELALGYQDVTGPSVYVALDLVPSGARSAESGDRSSSTPTPARRRILVWTTTPWTLVSNTALAVHPELDYVELRKRNGGDWTVILAEARVKAVLGDDYESRWEEAARMKGAELVGLRYRRPLDWVAYGEGKHELIVGEEFVSAEDGSGVVHMAPAFGADDYAAGKRHGLAFVQPVTGRGEFDVSVPVVGGLSVAQAEQPILDELKRSDFLWKAGTRQHSYPHCWRCGTPLIYYARSSWFVRTTAYRDEMLARNARVGWRPPEVGAGRFGSWLENNIDWAISRDRYWGTPLPIWICDASDDHREVIGSYAALEERTGRPLGEGFDPHKPYIDRHTWACRRSGCTGTMRRVAEVIDTWFDSGSMPFAQWHYPFENREVTERQYPADFIAEGVDQTRGWFYSLLAIAAGLGDALPNNSALGTRHSALGTGEGRQPGADTAPYRNVVVNDLVLDADGQKMSKSKGNVVDPWAVVGRHGADAVRIFLVSSSQVWVPRRFDESAIRETAGRFLLTLKNTYSGIFAQYANFGWSPSELDPPVAERALLDRWVLSRLASTAREADRLMADYDVTNAVTLVMKFFDEDVSKWYVRLSRPRFYDVTEADNRAAFATLHAVLVATCRLLAPVAPFVTDWMHRELTGDTVHLAEYAAADEAALDPALERAMEDVRELARLGRAAREEAGIKVRQPLARMVCVVPEGGPLLDALTPLLASELNIKRIEFASSADRLVTLSAKASFRTLGKKFGKGTPLAAQAIAALSSDALLAFERGEPLAITVDGHSRALDREDLEIVRRASGDLVVAEDHGYVAAIDRTVTAELRLEGLAREVVSRVQRMRKEAGFAVADRIRLSVAGDPQVEEAVVAFRDWIAEETLAREVLAGAELDSPHAAQTVDLDGPTARVAITRD